MRASPELQQSRRIMAPVDIAPVPMLIRLRETVLSISELRCPKWHFRLDAGLVLKLQARPGQHPLFLGTIIQGEGITLAHFKSWTARRGESFLAASMSVYDRPDREQWEIYFTRWSHRSLQEPDALVDFKARAIEQLTRLVELKASLQFSPACVCCGKPVTDPVSMARWIGPECAHNHVGRGTIIQAELRGRGRLDATRFSR
jgi:hypothetical protein